LKKDEKVLRAALSLAFDLLSEACPDYAFVIAMVEVDGKGGGALNYATNATPQSVQAIGEALQSRDWDGIPDPPEGISVQ
jgi:hypothetical protein